LQQVKRNLVIDYGEFGMHLPDADLIIYNPENYQDIIILSIKSTMRDRVAQTGYWKLKLMQSPLTEKTVVYFITLDEDGDLNSTKSYRKSRAIVEVDTDSCYVLTEETIEISDNVKTFDRFINDVEIWLSERKSDIQSS
jgi:type II restriction enzyme